MNIRKIFQRNILSVVLLLSLVFVLTPALADDWPMWRNNVGNVGSSDESILLPLTEQWHTTAPDVEENGAVVVNGIVYMATDDGWLFAFDVATGFDAPGFPVQIAHTWGTPAVDVVNGIIYGLAGTNMYALNLDGSSAWTMPVGTVGNNFFEGPVVEDGFVYFKAGGYLIKYDSTGEMQWVTVAGGMDTQPAIMGDFVYSNTESGQIQKFNKITGAQITTGGFPISTGPGEAALTVVDGRIFFKSAILYVYDDSDGSLLWSQPNGGDSTYSGTPAVYGGVVYTYGWDSRVYAFDVITGATMAGFPSIPLSSPGDRNYGSPSVAGNKIFIGAGTSQMLKVLGAAGAIDAGQVLAEHMTFSTDLQGFDLCSPAISDGWVFAMLDGGGLYAFFGGQGEPPIGALTINSGDECTESPDVVLSLDNNGNADVVEMRISEDPFFSGAQWVPYAATSNWTLSAGFGLKTVYAQLRDTFGLESNVFTDQIDYMENCLGDPPIGSLVINYGDGCTQLAEVVLTIDNNANPNVVEMMLSEDSGFAGATWVPFQTTFNWTLSTGFGLKTVYGQLRDSGLQVSEVFSDDIMYLEDCNSTACLWADATTPPLDNPTDGHGVAVGDFDNDGDDDLFLANAGENALLRNNGGGNFTAMPPLANNGGDSRGAAWGDFDNDGDIDLYVVNWESSNVLYRNDGGGVFVDVTEGPLACDLAGNNAAWADFDLDGDLDLFFTNYGAPNKLLRNDGGVFVLLASDAGFTDLSRGCAWGDYNDDRYPDLYVSVEDGANHLFRNDGGVLTDVTTAPLDDMGKGKGIAWGDYDNDGDLDLYLVNRFTANRLFNNDGGVFTNVADDVTGDVGDGRACGWGDYNNDGWLDLYITNNDGSNKLFENVHGSGFFDATCGDLLTPITAWGMGWFDYDNDGDLDIYVSNHNYQNLPNHLFRNELITSTSWLRIELAGVSSNRFGIGARVVVDAGLGDAPQMREISAGSGYMSAQASVAQFGLGEATMVDVTIYWPSGEVQTLTNQFPNQRLVITEASSLVGVGDIVDRPEFSVRNFPNPFNPATTIAFTMPDAGSVTLHVYDVTGRVVRTLLSDVPFEGGEHSVMWNGKDASGRTVASGIYLYRFTAGVYSKSEQMILLK